MEPHSSGGNRITLRGSVTALEKIELSPVIGFIEGQSLVDVNPQPTLFHVIDQENAIPFVVEMANGTIGGVSGIIITIKDDTDKDGANTREWVSFENIQFYTQ